MNGAGGGLGGGLGLLEQRQGDSRENMGTVAGNEVEEQPGAISCGTR